MIAPELPPYLRRAGASAHDARLAGVEVLLRSVRGAARRLYRLGSGRHEPLVLLPPYGVSFLLALNLATLLADRFQVLLWESVGSPDGSVEASDADFEFALQSADIAEMIGPDAAACFHFVGWCQAAQLMVHAIAVHGLAPRTMNWIAPAGFGLMLVKPEFDRCALPIYLAIERQGREAAEKLSRILDKYRDAPADEPMTGERLTMLHLADPAMTHVFARYMKCYEDNKRPAADLLPRALQHIPTQLLHCRDDTYSHYSESVQIAKRHPGATLHLMDQGGHLQIFNDPAPLASRIMHFIDEREWVGRPVTTC